MTVNFENSPGGFQAVMDEARDHTRDAAGAAIRDDLTAEQYHGDTKAIGKSGLDYVARSPAHYFAAYLDPHRQHVPPTPAMVVGTCWHYASLEPDTFTAKVVAVPAGIDKRTTAGKKALAELVEAHPGKILLAAGDYTTVCRMRDALHAHPGARVLIRGGVTERSFYWRCPDTGMRCKARPDYFRPDGVIVDLKSSEDARPGAFARSAWNYRYYVQSPWYLDGVTHALNEADSAFVRPELFVFIVQEKEPPYSVMVYEASAQFNAAGRMEYTRNMATYAACVRDGYWPTYPEEILPLDLPSWALRNAARDLA